MERVLNTLKFICNSAQLEKTLDIQTRDRAIRRRLVETPQSEHTREVLLQSIIHKTRYRYTASYYVARAEQLPLAEKQGIVLLVGLVNLADDFLDQKDIDGRQDKETLRRNILNARVKLDNQEIPIQQLYNETLASFPPNKQARVKHFLQDMIVQEISFPHREPGTYSYAQAKAYRQATSEAYGRLLFELVDSENPEQSEQTLRTGRFVQYLDDVLDIFDDHNHHAINPYIALAFEHGEGNVLAELAQKYAQNSERDSAIKRIKFSRKHIRSLPKTAHQIAQELQPAIEEIKHPIIRSILSYIPRFLSRE